MKLRNKKTGEIKPAEAREDGIYLYDETTEQWYKYELDLLAKYWEYYEEPKEYWCIDWTGGINHITVLEGTDEYEENKKQIGNYFETKEDAEKALEKLKAFKRLQDKGFKFEWWISKPEGNEIAFYLDGMEWSGQVTDDLDLLFGDKQ